MNTAGLGCIKDPKLILTQAKDILHVLDAAFHEPLIQNLVDQLKRHFKNPGTKNTSRNQTFHILPYLYYLHMILRK